MRFVTPTEAAYVLRCTREAVWRWVKDGTLPAFQMSESGKHCIDLHTFLARKGIDSRPYIEHLDSLRDSKKDEDTHE